MLKLTYNQTKKFSFIAATFAVIVHLFSLVFSQYINSMFDSVLIIASLLIYLSTSVISILETKRVLVDETARDNDNKAYAFTYIVITFFFCIMVAITIFAQFEITLSTKMIMCISLALQSVKDGSYLYFEKAGMKHAGIDDED
jgi:O-antigen ligase